MYCCGSPYQTITVRTGAHSLALLRCTHCDDQRWARDGVLLDRYSAFAELASAYRDVPLRARTARDRAAAKSAARCELRAAQRAATATTPSTRSTVEVDPVKLINLLEGWQVLGASA